MAEHSQYTSPTLTRATLLAPVLWTAYVLIPVRGWGVLDGAPLGALEVTAIFAVWWAWASARSLALARPMAGAIALKIVALALLLPQGFSAEYFANPEFKPPRERSAEYRGADASRIDPRLAFGRPGARDLPLFFFDDVGRFNFYQRGEPRRNQLPFSVVWDGYLLVEDGEQSRTFYLEATALGASLEIDGATILELPPGGGTATATVLYPKGWRHVVVRLVGHDQAARDFSAGVIDSATGEERPFGSELVFRAPAARSAILIDRAARFASLALDATVLAALLWFVVGALRVVFGHLRHGPRQQAAIAVAALVAYGEALRFAWPFAGRLLLQNGGDDSLTYQTYARDIILSGPLMRMGSAPGAGEAFYYQPLYPYFLGLIHMLFGDDLFGLFLVQRLSLFLVLWMLVRITAQLFGNRAATASLVVGGWFLYVWMDRWAADLWTEVLFVPLTIGWTCLLVDQAARRSGYGTAVLAGSLGGLAVLCRSTLLLALPFVVVMLWLARRKTAMRPALLATMVVVLGLVVSLATLRNWMVSGQFVPITTSFGINLYLGNTPPQGAVLHPVGEHTLDRWLPGDERSRPVFEWARHAPAEFGNNLWLKARYAGGFFAPLAPAEGRALPLTVMWVVALAGFVLAVREPRADAAMPVAAKCLPIVVAASMFAAVILIFPTHARLIHPAYVPLLPYIGVAVSALAERVLRMRAASAATPTPTA